MSKTEYHAWDKKFCTDTAPTYWECWQAAEKAAAEASEKVPKSRLVAVELELSRVREKLSRALTNSRDIQDKLDKINQSIPLQR